MLIEPLNKHHNRKLFDSGDEEVTTFLQQKALQDQEKDLSRTMVLVNEKLDGSRVVGYHTLLFAQVNQVEIPNDKPTIKRPIPCILLGQIGIDVSFQGKGYGELLLMDAQARVDEISRKIGIRAMVLDARNERLAAWYEKHDFTCFPNNLRMFKSISLIRKLNLLNG